jgi:hypothetical protein
MKTNLLDENQQNFLMFKQMKYRKHIRHYTVEMISKVFMFKDEAAYLKLSATPSKRLLDPCLE